MTVGFPATVPVETSRASSESSLNWIGAVAPSAPLGPDEAFQALKDAREYEALASAELSTLRTASRLADQARNRGETEWKHAKEELASAKARFDKLFEGGVK